METIALSQKTNREDADIKGVLSMFKKMASRIAASALEQGGLPDVAGVAADALMEQAGLPTVSDLQDLAQAGDMLKSVGQAFQNQPFQDQALYQATVVDIVNSGHQYENKTQFIAIMTFDLDGTSMTEKAYVLLDPSEAFEPGKIVLVKYDPDYQDPGNSGVKLVLVNKNP
jgi:hypothetical protein